MSLISFLPSFLIFAAQPLTSDPDLDLACNISSLHPSLLILHTHCTQDQLIYSSHFVFLSFVPLVDVGLKVLCFFSCIDHNILEHVLVHPL
jgi:hypothetical protein